MTGVGLVRRIEWFPDYSDVIAKEGVLALQGVQFGDLDLFADQK